MITLARDPQTRTLLQDPQFIDAWARLYERCPWGTVNQAAPFIKIWNDVYAARYELVLVYEQRDSELVGLLPMAMERSTQRLVAAGGIYAEYQVWLADPAANDQFITGALDTIRRTFPRQRLQFLFVPPQTPLEWATRGPWAARCDVRAIARPLMDVTDTARIEESLRKKHNRSHVNHLKRHGALSLTSLATGEALSEVHDEINAFSLLRLSGVHGEPLIPDPLKKPLFARLVDAGLVHVTILRAGDTMVSAQVHWRNKRESLRGMSAFSPQFAQHSPSNVHTLLLGLELARDGMATVDLTPGGEYKDRFATHEDTAYVLNIFANAPDRLRQKLRTRAAGTARRLFAMGTPTGAETPVWQRAITEAAKQRAPHRALAYLWHSLKAKPGVPQDLRVYEFSRDVAAALPQSASVHANVMQDLIGYRDASWGPTAPQFHRVAADRLRDGCDVFTEVANGELVRCHWLLADAADARAAAFGMNIALPAGSALVFDSCGHGPFAESLAHVLQAAAARPGVTQVCVAIAGSNDALEQAVVLLGGSRRAGAERPPEADPGIAAARPGQHLGHTAQPTAVLDR